MEVKLAHRFDAPGCANHTNVEIEISDEILTLDALCISISSKVRYKLNLVLWSRVMTDKESYYTYQAVGMYHFFLTKFIRPARWPELQHNDLPKPINTRLHTVWHQKYVK